MDISGLALMALLFVAGAQTPLLALLALRRRRTLLVVLGPYALLVPLALALAPALEEPARVGLLALAVAPAELAAPGLAPLLRARIDTTGAYVAGTVLFSFALTLAFMGTAGEAALGVVRDGAFAFLVGMTFAGALPMWRDRVLPLLRRLGDLALLVLIGIAILRGAPALSATAVLLALLVLGVGAAAAFTAARLGGGDRWSALAGSGTRDFAVAAAIAGASSPAAAALPLAYGAVLIAAGVLVVALRRAKPGRR